MANRENLFILAGNNAYDNRGCEGIVRSTIDIIRKYFNDPRFLVISHFNLNKQYHKQLKNEYDSAIKHKQSFRSRKRFDYVWWYQKIMMFFFSKSKGELVYKDMLPYLKDAKVVLSIGGDNYSLDYGLPTTFIDINTIALTHKKPIIIWGATVGPFDMIPEYEESIIRHLKKVTGIFARESRSVEYLASKNLTNNVYKVADPAFVMKSQEPAKEKMNFIIYEGAIGINFSPLLAKYVTHGDLLKWIEKAADIILAVSEKTHRVIYLIPHVTSPIPNSNTRLKNDYEFLKAVYSKIKTAKENIFLVPPLFNAIELKWIIGKMSVFAGNRTHSTIAALSSCVPTLTFAYSMKARGINEDIYGNTDYCIDPKDIKPGLIAERIGYMLANRIKIQKHLNKTIPHMQGLALKAGKLLKNIVNI